MYRKLSVCLTVLFLCFCFVKPAFALLDTSVYEGNPYNSTIFEFWKGLAEKHVGKDYLAFRSGQNAYVIIFGEDFECTGRTFYGFGDIYRIDTSTGTSYQHGYVISSASDDFSVSADDYIVFSNVGSGYPAIEGVKGLTYDQIISALLCALLVFGALRWIFNGK